MKRLVIIEEHDPRVAPHPGDVIERTMRPLKHPKQREVLAVRDDGEGGRFVRYKTPFGRPIEVRLDGWIRWAGLARIVKRGRLP